jgi:predicted N-acetyltransferase YhbS
MPARMSLRLVQEHPEHHDAIERVLDRAFGPGRHAKTSERVRERGAVAEPLLSRVAMEDSAVVGVCRIWLVSAGMGRAFFLGPLAVDPGEQHQGLGAALVRDAVNACRLSRNAGAVVLVGAAPFFQPLGFSVVAAGRVTLPGPVDPKRLLWCELYPGGLDHVEGEIGAPPA